MVIIANVLSIKYVYYFRTCLHHFTNLFSFYGNLQNRKSA